MDTNNRGHAMFEQAGKQALKVLMSPQGSKAIALQAKQDGPAKAIADALNGVAAAIAEAAKGAGVPLPPEVIQATQTSIAQVLVAMMVEAGLADDPDALMEELQPLLGEQPEPEPEPEQAMPEQAPQPPGALSAAARGGV